MKATSQGLGLYRSEAGLFYERPMIAGRRTWRKIRAPNLKLAREILAARRTDAARAAVGLARDPYGAGPVTVGNLLDGYRKQGCPDRRLQPRTGKQLYDEQHRISALLPFWQRRVAETIVVGDCVDYFQSRRRQIVRGHGGRTVDLELTTLCCCLHWAVAHGKLPFNRLAGARPKFRPRTIRHCRECMPANGAELHALARFFFEAEDRAVLGWQVLIEAMTGCRTSEALKLRWDSTSREKPGFIEGDWLWLHRSKGGVNPYALIHPALRECLAALRRWRDLHYPTNPWFLPSPVLRGQPIHRDALAHALVSAGRLVCDAKRTSHGLRAYFVTVRRSQGISDAQVAAEIGDKTGAAIIASTYGAIPVNWIQHGAPALDWGPGMTEDRKMPQEPAWAALGLPDNVVGLSAKIWTTGGL